MKVLQINSVVNSGSTGRIAENIGEFLIKNGHESYIAYGRGKQPSSSNLIKIGSLYDVLLHGFYSFFFDRHGFGSKSATKKLIKKIDEIKPDIISLHNIHGYYLNIEVFFNYVKTRNIPLLWTFHDCWPFTGHCVHFESISCQKWKDGCYDCQKRGAYPKSFFIDNSKRNYLVKKQLFSQVDNITIITPSIWLKTIVKQSFLNYPVVNIPNGINLNHFIPVSDTTEIKNKYNITSKKIILGVASVWDRIKGLEDFLDLQLLVSGKYQIILVGLNKMQIKSLPQGIIGISKTESITELAILYSLADVFVNPTYQDNFPTTNIEAMACGTPVITYNTGGSPEALDEFTGIVVEKGNLIALKNAIDDVLRFEKEKYSKACRLRAENFYDMNYRYNDYLALYANILKK